MDAVAIDCDESQVSRADVPLGSGDVILHPDLDADLHRGVEGAIHRRSKHEQVADVHGREKIKMIGGSGDDEATRMAMTGESSGDIDQMHEASAEQIAQRIGVVRKDNFHHLRLRFAHRARQKSVFRICHRVRNNPRL